MQRALNITKACTSTSANISMVLLLAIIQIFHSNYTWVTNSLRVSCTVKRNTHCISSPHPCHWFMAVDHVTDGACDCFVLSALAGIAISNPGVRYIPKTPQSRLCNRLRTGNSYIGIYMYVEKCSANDLALVRHHAQTCSVPSADIFVFIEYRCSKQGQYLPKKQIMYI